MPFTFEYIATNNEQRLYDEFIEYGFKLDGAVLLYNDFIEYGYKKGPVMLYNDFIEFGFRGGEEECQIYEV